MSTNTAPAAPLDYGSQAAHAMRRLYYKQHPDSLLAHIILNREQAEVEIVSAATVDAEQTTRNFIRNQQQREARENKALIKNAGRRLARIDNRLKQISRVLSQTLSVPQVWA